MKSSTMRRNVVLNGLGLATLLLVGAAAGFQPAVEHAAGEPKAGDDTITDEGLTVEYLEFVTPDVEKTCNALAATHGVEFGDPVPEFGNARTAALKNGGLLGVRAPMRATETPIVRPYLLVDDIDAAVKAAEEAGAKIALPPIQLPGRGTFSIYILGGIEHGLWQR